MESQCGDGLEMKQVFGKWNMRWRTVILFAIAAGVYTGAVMLVDGLKDTSFQDIGISYEWWVLFAVIIVVNCKKSWEAMLKCFVFFLLSQPLVYATEVIFGTLTADMAIYYYRTIWLPMTFLTLPGGLIAYYCKKQNLLGAVILGLGNSIQAVLGLSYLLKVMRSFPHHLLTTVVCFGSIFLMSVEIQKKKSLRLVALVLPVLITVVLSVLLKASGRTL